MIVKWQFIILFLIIQLTDFIKGSCSIAEFNTISLGATCETSSGEPIPCSYNMPTGTVAHMKCKEGYTMPKANVGTRTECQSSGEWDFSAFECDVECGIVDESPDANLMPWHVGIYARRYQDYEYVCGASIVTAYVVTGSAHCFWDSDTDEVKDAHLFRVVAGKINRNYYVSETGTQESTLSYIDIPRAYSNAFGTADYSVLHLNSPLIFNANIKPTCISFDLFRRYKDMPSNIVGRVAGYDYIRERGYSDLIRPFNFYTVDFSTCMRRQSFSVMRRNGPDGNFMRFLAPDKFCVENSGINLCETDDGAGFMAPFTDTINGKQTVVFYLLGIMSAGGARKKDCEENDFTIYSSMHYLMQHMESLPERPNNNQNPLPLPTTTPAPRALWTSPPINLPPPLVFTPSITPTTTTTTTTARTTTTTTTPEPTTTTALPACKESPTKVNFQNAPCSGDLIFEENFDGNRISDKWEVERRFGSVDPDNEFVIYLDRRENLKVRDGQLMIKPTLKQDSFSSSVTFNIEDCTDEGNPKACTRSQNVEVDISPPIMSARVNTMKHFKFLYGKVEIRAKLPSGNWIYPQLLLEPVTKMYGDKLQSGQMRMAFASGGPCNSHDLYQGVILDATEPFRTPNLCVERLTNGDQWSSDFHNYTLIWTPDLISMYIDEKLKCSIDPGNGFSERKVRGEKYPGAPKWKQGTCSMAPFDQEFYLAIGVGVGGLNDFQESTHCPLPWGTRDPRAMRKFWAKKNEWSPSWVEPNTSLLVDYVRVYAI